MPRRHSNPLLDQALKLFTIAPIWVGPVIALFMFALCWTLPYLFPETGPLQLQKPLFHLLAFLIAGMLLVAWLASLFYKLSNHLLFRHHHSNPAQTIPNISWQDFEQLVAEAYRRKGYLAEVVANPAGDGGIDIELHANGQRTLVQCKHWKAFKVGVSPVRELLGTITHERAHRGILVTSGAFTHEARRFAQANPALQLLDGPALANLLQNIPVPSAKRPEPSPAPAYTAPQPPAPTTTPSRIQPPLTARPASPNCPSCGIPMILRTAARGYNPGTQFYGCQNFPRCRQVLKN